MLFRNPCWSSACSAGLGESSGGCSPEPQRGSQTFPQRWKGQQGCAGGNSESRGANGDSSPHPQCCDTSAALQGVGISLALLEQPPQPLTLRDPSLCSVAAFLCAQGLVHTANAGCSVWKWHYCMHLEALFTKPITH